jgi:hypothetical protein
VFYLLDQEAAPELEKVWPVDPDLLEGISAVWGHPLG